MGNATARQIATAFSTFDEVWIQTEVQSREEAQEMLARSHKEAEAERARLLQAAREVGYSAHGSLSLP